MTRANGKRWIALAVTGWALAVHAGENETARTRFAWTPGLVARVEVRLEGRRSAGPDLERSWSAAYSFTQRVVPEGSRLRVEREPLTGWTGDPPASPLGMRDAAFDAIPVLIVGSDGDLVAIEGSDRVRGRLEAAFGASGSAVVRQLDSLGGEAELLDLARDHWSAWIGNWRGKMAAAGTRIPLQSARPLPGLPGAAVEAKGQAWIEEWVPCSRQGSERTCGRFRAQMAVDPETAAADIAAARAPASSRKTSLASWEFRQQAEVLAERDTLVPHRLTSVRSSRLEAVSGETGTRTALEEECRKTSVFDYDAP